MGKALLNLVAEHRSKKFIVDKNQQLLTKSVANRSRGEVYTGLGGLGRLTTKAIKSIQGHYGAAIRDNDSVASMRTAIWHIFHHRNGNHQHCPDWCTSENADKHRLPPFVCNYMRPVFERLSSDELLTKCTHGGTQNANESFHHLIWARCPKEKFCGIDRIKLATAVATITFNDGEVGLLDWYKHMGLNTGTYHVNYASNFDRNRVQQANRAVQVSQKGRRKKTQINNARDDYDGGNF